MSEDATRNANVNLNANVDGYTQSVQQASAQTNVLASNVDKLASKLDGLQRRTAKRLTLFGAADMAMMTSMVAVTASYQKQMTTLTAQSAITGRSMSALSGNIRQMTRDLPVARGEIIATATAISKMGVTSSRDITGLTETFTKTAAAAGESAIAIGQSMTMLSRQMGTLSAGAPQMQKFTDSLLTVSAQAGVSAQSVADFSNSIAPIANVAKMSQAQVLGLSTAFVQAGNDGYAAATTFNKMLSDIVQTTTEGGPGLDKYASLLGITVKQFKDMPAADQITGIFKAINAAGPNSIAILNQMGYDGIRATKAISAMASQTGGLEKMIQTATGAYGNDATNTGAKEAMGGLTDQMQRFGNLAQDMATSIGAGIIAPLTGGLNVLNNLLAQGAKLSGVFAAGGALAGAGGMAAMGAGTLGTVASYAALPVALRWMWNSKPMGAMREGLAQGKQLAGPNPNYDQALRQPYMQRYQSGEAGRLERSALAAGGEIGTRAGQGQTVGGGLGRVVGAPFRGVAVFADAQRKFYNEAGTPGSMRSNSDLENMLGIKKGALGAEIKAHTSLTASITKAAVAATRFTMAEGRAGLGAAAAVAKPVLGGMASSAMGFLGGPWGLALMGGMGLLALKSKKDQGNQEMTDRATTDQFYNQMIPYNTELGTATTNLTIFSGSLTGAANAAKTIDDALTRATGSVMSKGTPINANASAITTPEQGAAYLRSLGTNDPTQIQSAAKDVLRVLGPDQGQKSLDLYKADQKGNAGNDLNTLARGINASSQTGTHAWDTIAMKMDLTAGVESDKASQLAIGGIGADVSRYSGSGQKAQAQAQANDIRDVIKGFLASGGTDTQKTQSYNQLAGLYGMPQINTTRYADKKNGGRPTATTWEQFIQAAPEVGQWMANTQAKQGVDWFSNPETALKNATMGTANPETTGLQGLGIDLNSSAVKGVLPAQGGLPNNPNAQAQIIEAMYAEARAKAAGQVKEARAANAKKMGLKVTDPSVIATSGTVSDYANQNLANVRGVVTNPDDPSYGPLNTASSNAQSLVGNDLSLQGVTQTRVQKLASSRTQYLGAKAAYDDPKNLDKEKYQNYVSAQASYKQQMASYTQYMQEMLRTQEQFQLQMGRSDRDYRLQLQYSREDFQKSEKRSKDDFNLSMTRQAQDTAKTIYNPMQRVQSQYTTDVGTLKQNMNDQTSRIKRQVANLRKLKKLGLSQSTIDMLQLADPSNAQQVEELTQEMTKGDAATLNRQASARLGATKGLTQSDLNQNYTRSVADFKKSIDRGIQDYNIGMARMATSHRNQVNDARADLALLSKEYTDDFTTTFAKAQTIVARNLGKTANLTTAELDAIKKAFPEFFSGLPSTGASGTAASTGDGHPGGRTGSGVSPSRPAKTTQSTSSVTTSRTTNSTTFTGPILVTSSDPFLLAKKIADAQRIDRLKRG